MYIFAGNGFWYNHPEMLFFCNLERNFFIIYKFFYEVTGYVETGTGYIVVGTSLSCVDLKEFVAVVADIIFDIKLENPT